MQISKPKFYSWVPGTGGKILQNFFSKTFSPFTNLKNIFYELPRKIDFYLRYPVVFWNWQEFSKTQKFEKSAKSPGRRPFLDLMHKITFA